MPAIARGREMMRRARGIAPACVAVAGFWMGLSERAQVVGEPACKAGPDLRVRDRPDGRAERVGSLTAGPLVRAYPANQFPNPTLGGWLTADRGGDRESIIGAVGDADHSGCLWLTVRDGQMHILPQKHRRGPRCALADPPYIQGATAPVRTNGVDAGCFRGWCASRSVRAMPRAAMG